MSSSAQDRFRWSSRVVLLCGACCFIAPIAASNLTAPYPDPDCGSRPEEPQRPAEFKTEAEVRAYNVQVDTYNRTMDAYFQCIQTYLDNAALDIRRIRDKSQALIDANNAQ